MTMDGPGWNTPDENGKLPGIDRGWAYAPGKSVAADLRNIVATKAAKLPEGQNQGT
jgi:hypothetical protein